MHFSPPVSSPHRYKTGRPTKRTKAVLTPLFEAIRIGVPYKLACMAAGISVECFNKWRQNDPEFDAEVERAAAESAVKLFSTICKQAPETWQAGAWTLERRYPEMFAKPEAQLNITAEAAVVNSNGAPRNIEAIVVSDLEFLGLKRHPAYEHRAPVRELEEVPSEASGSLERNGENFIVVSESQAAVNAQRMAEIRAETLKRLNAMAEAQRTHQQGEASESGPVSARPEPTAPATRKPASWWGRFIFPGAPLPKADAILALRLVLGELCIGVDEQALSFQSDPVSQGTFTSTLMHLTGSDLGWRTLIQIYEREQRRADH